MFEGLYDEHGQIPFIRKLCAGLSEAELQRAERRYVRFLELTWEVCEEAEFDLTSRDDPRSD